jgi:hypothetical protein
MTPTVDDFTANDQGLLLHYMIKRRKVFWSSVFSREKQCLFQDAASNVKFSLPFSSEVITSAYQSMELRYKRMLMKLNLNIHKSWYHFAANQPLMCTRLLHSCLTVRRPNGKMGTSSDDARSTCEDIRHIF